MANIPTQNSDGSVQSVQIDVMPEVSQSIKTQIPQITTNDEKTESSTNMISHLIYYNQGDEDYLQDAMLEFFSKNPKIVYNTTWTIGITTYFMFIYR